MRRPNDATSSCGATSRIGTWRPSSRVSQRRRRPKQRVPAAWGDAAAAHAVIAHCFDTALRLLHPVVPFITEELWQKLPGRKPDELLAAAAWPSFKPELVDSELDLQFLRIKQVVEEIRSIRA